MNLHGTELTRASDLHGQTSRHSALSSYYDTERDLQNPFADTSCILSPDTEHVERDEQVRDGGNGDVQESEDIDGTNTTVLSSTGRQQEALTVSVSAGSLPKVGNQLPDPLQRAHTHSEITIIDACSYRDIWGREAIGYIISYNNKLVTRRYSEFESLHQILRRLLPTIIIPPIPPKHSVLTYLMSPINAENDVTIIEARKRKFQSFLINCFKTDEIRGNFVFQKFLDPEYIWKDVVSSPPVSILPSNNLLAPPLNPIKPSPLHLLLPAPTSPNYAPTVTLENSNGDLIATNKKFVAIEVKLSKYMSSLRPLLSYVKQNEFHLTSLAVQLAELSVDYKNLGLGSGFPKGLLAMVDKVGDSFGLTQSRIELLVNRVRASVEENIEQLYDFILESKRVIYFRNLKICQYLIVQNTLNKRSRRIEELKAFETRLLKLDNALDRGAIDSPTIAHIVENIRKGSTEDLEETDTVSRDTTRQEQLQHRLQRRKKKRSTRLGGVEPEFLTKAERDREIQRLNTEVEKLTDCFNLVKRDVEQVNDSTLRSLLNLIEFVDTKLDLMLGEVVSEITHILRECLGAWREVKESINDTET